MGSDRFEAQPPPGHQQVRSYRNWNPPLLGNLPDDFLRILPQQLDSIKQSSQSSLSQPSSSSSVSSTSQWTAQSGSQSGAAGTSGSPGLTAGATEQDKKLKQYLEDERIALFLQNEEFMRELQRNREFLVALERGEQYSAASMEAVSDDALFRDKLKHMGKSTRKKLFEIARTFSEKTKRRKSKRKLLLKHHSYSLLYLGHISGCLILENVYLPQSYARSKCNHKRKMVSPEEQTLRKKMSNAMSPYYDPHVLHRIRVTMAKASRLIGGVVALFLVSTSSPLPNPNQPM
ncbi:CUE domain-containing protein 1 [Liparis tanakae]|uniref:CUE domain-containing protein 1 n=1 Tax=Liparis tanakae TaxID=230148 RepID=A0A4Z2IRX3_9TELE|nr:CUE domain-containing protein 1 [Liparis tanakae]